MKSNSPQSAQLAQSAVERLNSDGAAAYLGLASPTLANMRSKGRGPRYLKLGSRVFYRKADLDAYLERAVKETSDSRAA